MRTPGRPYLRLVVGERKTFSLLLFFFFLVFLSVKIRSTRCPQRRFLPFSCSCIEFVDDWEGAEVVLEGAEVRWAGVILTSADCIACCITALSETASSCYSFQQLLQAGNKVSGDPGLSTTGQILSYIPTLFRVRRPSCLQFHAFVSSVPCRTFAASEQVEDQLPSIRSFRRVIESVV